MCARSLSKLFLFVVNSLVFLAGAAAIAGGIWLKIDSNSLLQFLKVSSSGSSVDASISYVTVLSIVLIVGGAILFVIGFCGCCGAWREVIILLVIYATVIIIIFLILVAAGILSYVFKQQVIDTVGNYSVNMLNQTFDDNLTSSYVSSVAWFQMMQMFQCCGWTGQNDFSLLSFCNYDYQWACAPPLLQKRQACVYLGNNFVCTPASLIPSACCRYNNSQAIMAGDLKNAQIVDPLCPKTPTSSNSYAAGCSSSVTDFVSGKAILFMIIAFASAGVLLLAIVASFILICAIKREPDPGYRGV